MFSTKLLKAKWILCGLWSLALAGSGRLETVQSAEKAFRRGDVNNDGRISLADPLRLARYLSEAAPSPDCEAAADIDADGQIGLTDVISLLRHLFEGRESLTAPFPGCGLPPVALPKLPCEGSPVCDGLLPSESSRYRFVLSDTKDDATEFLPPIEVFGLPGEIRDLPIYVTLQNDPQIDQGAEAWFLHLSASVNLMEASLVDITTDGTGVGPNDPEGLFLDGHVGGSQSSEEDPFLSLVHAEALSLTEPRSLDPRRAAQSILRVTVRMVVPPVGTEGSVFLTTAGDFICPPCDLVPLEVVVGSKSYEAEVSEILILVSALAPSHHFTRGDANQDGVHDISDALHTISRAFLGGPDTSCADAADSNDDGRVDLSDAIFTLGCLFLGADCPPAPFPTCGDDATLDGLGCDATGAACD